MPRLSLSLALLSTALGAAPAAASTGGAEAPRRPVVRVVQCVDGHVGRCARGATLWLRGTNLRDARHVVFVGRPAHRDARVVPVHPKRDDQLAVAVPMTARTGPVVAVGAKGASSRRPRLVVLPSREDAEQGAVAGVFPVRGSGDFGSAVNRFGGGRNHQGQDILAECGLPVVAAVGGIVRVVARQSAAGNYVVVDTAAGASNVYMHLRRAATVDVGEEVAAGAVLGRVGRTGHATACHLHFEQWTAPGWYRAGHAVDPLPELRRWESSGSAPPR